MFVTLPPPVSAGTTRPGMSAATGRPARARTVGAMSSGETLPGGDILCAGRVPAIAPAVVAAVRPYGRCHAVGACGCKGGARVRESIAIEPSIRSAFRSDRLVILRSGQLNEAVERRVIDRVGRDERRFHVRQPFRRVHESRVAWTEPDMR